MKLLLFYTLTAILLILGNIILGGHMSAVFQTSSALFVIVPTILYFVLNCGIKNIPQFVGRVSKESITNEDAQLLEATISIAFLFSGIGAVLGLIHAVENLVDVQIFSKAIASTFVSIFYGFVICVVLLPLRFFNKSSSQFLRKLVGISVALVLVLFFTFSLVLFNISHKT